MLLPPVKIAQIAAALSLNALSLPSDKADRARKLASHLVKLACFRAPPSRDEEIEPRSAPPAAMLALAAAQMKLAREYHDADLAMHARRLEVQALRRIEKLRKAETIE